MAVTGRVSQWLSGARDRGGDHAQPRKRRKGETAEEVGTEGAGTAEAGAESVGPAGVGSGAEAADITGDGEVGTELHFNMY